MSNETISRREFLKLAGAASISLPLIDLKQLVSKHSPQSNLPNILILVFDALSARNMSLYGYKRQTTPNFDKFAENSFVFHRNHSSGSFTTSSTASLLTGVYPWRHRALQLRGNVLPLYEERNIFKLLEGNYYSFAYTHNILVYILLDQLRQNINELFKLSTNCLASASFADAILQRDFNIAFQAESLMFWKKFNASSSVLAWLMEWLKRKYSETSLAKQYKDFPYGLPKVFEDDLLGIMFFKLEDTFNWLLDLVESLPQPYIGYVHVLPPHDPYNTKREFMNKFSDGWQPDVKPRHYFQESYTDGEIAYLNQQYDEFILYADAEFGRLINSLKLSGVLNNTILIVTSDHGELHERGITGHVTPVLYEPLTHIPLLISLPGQSERKDIYHMTNTVDIIPTILGLIGQEIPDWCEGGVLPEMGLSSNWEGKGNYTIDAKDNPNKRALKMASFAFYKDQYKLARYLGYPGLENVYELYNLADDPEELDNLYSHNNTLSRALIQELEDQLRQKDIH